MLKTASFLTALMLWAGLPETPAPKCGGDVEEVASLLTGTFDSTSQAEADPQGYRSVRIVAVGSPGSRLGQGSPVLYVEQALLATPEKPYRQRLYRIEASATGKVVSRVFELKDPAAAAGRWRSPDELAALGPADVVERAGCAVTLVKEGAAWQGSTSGEECPSALSGARYATSRARLTADRMESWDRGFDASGQQVWGAKAGPYLFQKRAPGPPPTR